MGVVVSVARAGALQRVQARLQRKEVLLAYLDELYLVTSSERAGAAYLLVTDEVWRTCAIEPTLGKTVSWNRAGTFLQEAALVLGDALDRRCPVDTVTRADDVLISVAVEPKPYAPHIAHGRVTVAQHASVTWLRQFDVTLLMVRPYAAVSVLAICPMS